jgi:precorrin-2 dehydrogenase/sirohydrochlorin ferrochelatase
MAPEGIGCQRLFPLLQALQGKKIVVIGGGSVAERKIRSLLECEARVTAIAPSLTPGLSELAASQKIEHAARSYRAGDLAGATLAFVATDDPEVSAAAAGEANRLGVPVNVVDQPRLCTFVIPAVLRRGRLTIAVSTGGASPAWAGRIKERLAEEFTEEYAQLLDALARVRRDCQQSIDDPARRQLILRKLADDSLLDLARSGGAEALEAELRRRVAQELEELDR